MASLRIRGQNATIQVIVNGRLQKGSFARVENYKLTPKIDFTPGSFLGEKLDEPDYQHHGYSFTFTLFENDSSCQDLLDDIVAREAAGSAPPNITIVVRKQYRDGGRTPGRTDVLTKVVLKPDEEGAGGRKDFVKWTWTGECQKKSKLPNT
jgi:hypothetical protein